MNNGLFTYLAALLLFGSNGIIAAAIALPSSDIVPVSYTHLTLPTTPYV